MDLACFRPISYIFPFACTFTRLAVLGQPNSSGIAIFYSCCGHFYYSTFSHSFRWASLIPRHAHKEFLSEVPAGQCRTWVGHSARQNHHWPLWAGKLPSPHLLAPGGCDRSRRHCRRQQCASICLLARGSLIDFSSLCPCQGIYPGCSFALAHWGGIHLYLCCHLLVKKGRDGNSLSSIYHAVVTGSFA